MRTFIAFVTVFYMSLMTSKVSAHGLVTQVTGANGVTGTGFGVDPSTPRDCTQRNPCQQDTSIMIGRRAGCGRTIQSGRMDPAAEIQKQLDIGGGQLPSTGANGMLTMTYHQVNADGAGPLTAEVDTTGTGTNWQRVQVVQNAPGRFGLNRATATTDQNIAVRVPANMRCTGGPNGDACVMRIKNPIVFGSCVAFTN
ncbi:hypothetical protein BC829DRAFT_367812 [Chytridium lagenaria]|nr:hypothetical protein BC829DRAFT_367812 [Chytridium lagenaria]